MKKVRSTKGITLVALIITVVILIIIAAVTIKLAVDMDIVRMTTEGAEKYQKEQIQEEDEIRWTEDFLADALEKITNTGKINTAIKIKTEKTFNEDNSVAKIRVEVEYQGEIKSIYINDKKVLMPEKINGVYVVEKELTENGIYAIIAKDEKGDYQIAEIKINEILGDMYIYNEEDLELYRQRIEEGTIFADTKVKVMQDITLTKEWKPIGETTERPVRGTFDGQGHTIKDINMNTDNGGFCKYIEGATIKNLTLRGEIICSSTSGGVIRGAFGKSTISNVKNYININCTGEDQLVGGIAAYVEGEGTRIESCINYGEIKGKSYSGGIVGCGYSNFTIDSCGNKGNITGRRSCWRNFRTKW